jgi:PAS domain S-box-containing protein
MNIRAFWHKKARRVNDIFRTLSCLFLKPAFKKGFKKRGAKDKIIQLTGPHFHAQSQGGVYPVNEMRRTDQMKSLKLLLVEDSEEDAVLLLLRLRQGGYKVHCERVDTAPAMRAALRREPWDLVIADYVMPQFSGLAALELLKQQGADIPFIIVSGHIGEDTAVEAMKAGAHDYLMKDNLARLLPAVERELAEAEIRQARRQSEEELLVEHTFRKTIEASIPSGIAVVDLNRRQTYVNPGFCAMVGWSERELVGSKPPFVYWPKEDQVQIAKTLDQIMGGNAPANGIELRFRRRDGERFYVFIQVKALIDSHQIVSGWVWSATEITELKRAEEALREAHDELELRVQQRTADLAAAYDQLRTAIEARKRLEHELLDITERERRRIGLELHDDLGQRLTGIAFMLKGLELNLKKTDAKEAQYAAKIHALFTDAMNHAKDVARHLTSLNVKEQSLPSALKRLAGQVRTMFKIGCTFRTEGTIPSLPENIVQQLYKISQEAVTNAIRHAKADKVVVKLTLQNDMVVLSVRNNGLPFPAMQNERPGVGLRIMHYRANLIGASLEIKPMGRQGTFVSCSLPLQDVSKIAVEAGKMDGPAVITNSRRRKG